MSLLIQDDYPEPADPPRAAGNQRGWLGRRSWPGQLRRAPGPDQDAPVTGHLLISDHDPAAAPHGPAVQSAQHRYENPYGHPYDRAAAGDLRYLDLAQDLDDDLAEDEEAGDGDPYDPEPADGPERPEGLRGYVTTPQRLGGILLAVASVLAVAFYVPSVFAADQHSFTGVVSNTAIASLNFGAAGRVGKVMAHLGQVVGKGQVLATEDAPAAAAALQTDRVAVAADKSNLAALEAEAAPSSSITAVENQLATDRARRAAARMKLLATEIVAPAAGTVLAIYGQAGETATPAGLRGSASGQNSPGQQHRFSLLPSGPMASFKTKNGLTPVLALRTSGGWQVRLLIPQSSVSGVRVGKAAAISVPAAGLTGVHGTITELSPTPVSTSDGASYEAVISVRGHTPVAPLSGMSANVQLGS